MLVGELVDWLNRNFERDDGIWIDEGGLQLQGVTHGEFGDAQRLYNEVGGEPEEDEDDEEADQEAHEESSAG